MKKTIIIIICIVVFSTLIMPPIFNLVSKSIIKRAVSSADSVTFIDLLENIQIVSAEDKGFEFNELTDVDIAFLNEVIENTQNMSKIPESRPLNSSESKRLLKLQEKYCSEGLRPQIALSYPKSRQICTQNII